jgi:hypothetical protein
MIRFNLQQRGSTPKERVDKDYKIFRIAFVKKSEAYSLFRNPENLVILSTLSMTPTISDNFVPVRLPENVFCVIGAICGWF